MTDCARARSRPGSRPCTPRRRGAPALALAGGVLLLFVAAPASVAVAAPEPPPPGPLQEELDAAFGRVRDVPAGPLRLTLRGEARWRGEYRDPFDLARNGDRGHDMLHLFRTRLGLQVSLPPWAKLYVEAQDSEATDDPRHPDPAIVQDTLDLQQGYVELSLLDEATMKLVLRAGRQHVDLGTQRLIGSFQFSNVARSFDAVRATADLGTLRIDAIAGWVVTHEDDHANEPDEDVDWFIVNVGWRPAEKIELEVYEIVRLDGRDNAIGEDGRRGNSDAYTFGGRGKAPLVLGVDVAFEAAGQWGRRAHDEVAAWAVTGTIGYEPPPILPVRTRLAFETSLGSGDDDPADGRLETFDNLYPTNHPFYGLMDLFSWRNLQDYELSLRVWPLPRLVVGADVHLLRLMERKDAWRDAGGRVLRRDATGQSGRTVAWEIDLLANYKLNTYIEIEVVYGHLHPLGFVQATDPEGDDADPAHLGYAQVRFAF